MARLSKYCLSVVLILILSGCKKIDQYYDQVDPDKKVALAAQKYQSLKDTNFFKQGNYYDNMVKYYNILEEAKELDPNNAKVWAELARNYLKKGMVKEWKDSFDKALFLDPIKYQGVRGHILMYRFRDYRKALADFKGLEALNPKGTDYVSQTNISYLMALCYMQLGEYKQALKYFDKYMSYEAKAVGDNYIYDSCYLYKGVTYIRMKEYQKAIDILDVGLTKDSEYADFYYHKARALFFLGQYDPILDLLDEAEHQLSVGNNNTRYDCETIEEIYIEDVLDFRSYIKKKIEEAL